MPLIKISPLNNKNLKKLVLAKNLDELKIQAEKKLEIKIETFVREHDLCEIEDDDILFELLGQEKELWLLAKDQNNNHIKSVKVYTSKFKDPILIQASSLKSLKQLSEEKFKIEIEKFVREDGVEIDDEDIFLSLLNTTDMLSLIALEDEKEYSEKTYEKIKPIESSIEREKKIKKTYLKKNADSSEDDEDQNNQESQLDDLIKLIQGLTNSNRMNSLKKEPEKNSKTMFTEEIKKKQIDLERELEEQGRKKREKEEEIKKLNELSTTLLKSKEEMDRLDKEIKKKKFESIETKMQSKTDLAKKEAKLLELEIKQKRISQIFYDLKQAEKVDACFMIDCTGSMSSYIAETKIVINRICDKLKTRFESFDLRVSFVGYRDHSDGDKRITVFPFTKEIDEFKRFVSSVEATGGADECEDVFGGLEEVGKLEWLNISRVLIHVGDAPCHGNRFHSGASDSYQTGDPRGLNITDLIKKIVSLNVIYYFAEINKSTLKMVEEFDKELLANQGKKITVVSLASASDLTEMVTKSIVTTIMTSKSESVHLTKHTKLKTLVLDPVINWDISRMIKYSAIFNKLTYDGTLSEIKSKKLNQETNDGSFWIAKLPFSNGAMRYAYIGTNQISPLVKYVVKESRSSDEEYNTEKYYKEFMENHVLASYLSRLFTQEIKKKGINNIIVKYVDIHYLHVKETGKYFTFENYLDGNFIKWISNGGVVNEDDYSCIMDAFAHWTYDATDEYLIVLDLQGIFNSVSGKKEYILTDPAIICPEDNDRFGPTNLALKGIKKYFETHGCNHICELLDLSIHKYQKKPNRVSDSCV